MTLTLGRPVALSIRLTPAIRILRALSCTPNIGNLNDYSLYLWENGKWVFDTYIGPDTVFDFAAGGVSEFQILGINPAVDPSNGNEFRDAGLFRQRRPVYGFHDRGRARAVDLGNGADWLLRPRTHWLQARRLPVYRGGPGSQGNELRRKGGRLLMRIPGGTFRTRFD